MNRLILAVISLLATSAFSYGNMKNKEGFQKTRVLSNDVTGASKQVSGVVVKTINAASYTYILLKADKGEVWAASNSVKLKVGDKILLDKVHPMENFHSKTLNRTFKKILFVQNVAVLKK